MHPKQSTEPTNWCQPPALCLLQSAPCPIPPHTILHPTSTMEQALPCPKCQPHWFSCCSSLLVVKTSSQRLGTKTRGTSPSRHEAVQGGRLWLKRQLCPQSYVCDLAHHISCCSLPVQRAGAMQAAQNTTQSPCVGQMSLGTGRASWEMMGMHCCSTLQHGPCQKPTTSDITLGTTMGGDAAGGPACRVTGRTSVVPQQSLRCNHCPA